MTLPLLWRKALRDFAAMGLRAWLTFGVLAAGVAVYAGGFLAQQSVLATRDHYYDALALADLDLTFKPADLEELPPWMLALTRGDASGLRALGGEAGAMRFVAPGAIEVGGDRPVMSLEVHVDPRIPLAVNRFEIVEGRALTPGRSDEVLVEATAARINGFHVGEKLVLDPYNTVEEVEVVGIARTAEYLLPTANPDILLPSKGSLVVLFRSLDRFTKAFGAPMFNDVALRIAGAGADAATRERFVAAARPLVMKMVVDRDGQFSHRFLEEDVKAFGIFVPVVAGLFGVVTALVLLLSITRLIAQEQRPIGALLALGRRPGELLAAYVVAALVWGGGASVVGALLSPLVGRQLSAAYGEAIGLPPIVHVIALEPMLVAAGLGLLAAVGSVVFAARGILRLVQASAMRGGGEVAFAGLPRLLDAAVRGLAPSMALRFGMRNLLRRPRLTLAVVSLIAVSLALSLAFRFSHVAWNDYADYAFAHEKWDAIVAYKVPLGTPDASAILATPGLGRVEPFVSAFGAICDGPDERSFCLDHRLVGIPGGDGLRAFRLVEGGRFETDDEPAIVLNRNFNHVRPYRVGEEVWLRHGERRERVRVAGLTSDMTIGLGYVPIGVARRLLGLPDETTGFMATFTAPPREMKKRLFAHESVTYVSLKLELQEIVVEYLRTIQSIITTATIISVVLAALFMLTGMSMAVLERESEYATLRTYGFGGGEVAKMITVEVIAEAGIAALLSAPLGIALALYLQYAMATAWFEVAFTYRMADFARILAPGLLALPFAAVPPLWRLLRTPPAAALRARDIG